VLVNQVEGTPEVTGCICAFKLDIERLLAQQGKLDMAVEIQSLTRVLLRRVGVIEKYIYEAVCLQSQKMTLGLLNIYKIIVGTRLEIE
jgi:hypothetical protein